MTRARRRGSLGLLNNNTFDDLIIGSYTNGTDYSGGQFILVIEQVPEPSSMALLGLAAGAAMLRRRRRRA